MKIIIHAKSTIIKDIFKRWHDFKEDVMIERLEYFLSNLKKIIG